MKKIIYSLTILFGFGLCCYFYLVIFDDMSETELLNSVLYWYTPFVFGLYGLSAIRVKKNMRNQSQSVVEHLFSGKDTLVTVWLILLAIANGLIGLFFYILPLSIFKANNNNFDLKVAFTGTLIWIVLLFGFLVFLFPSL